MDQEVIVIEDDELSQQKNVTKSIKRRSTAAIPTKKSIKRSKKVSDATEISITPAMNPSTQSNGPSSLNSTPVVSTSELHSKPIPASVSMPASPSNDILHNGIMNIAQELAMNRNNATNSLSPKLPTATTSTQLEQTPIITTNTPTHPNVTQPNDVKQVKISSLLATTVTPTHRRLLNPGNGSMEQPNTSNTPNTITTTTTTVTPTPNGSSLFAKSMQLLNNKNKQESNEYIPSITATPINSIGPITPNTTTLPQKNSTGTTKKKAPSTSKTKKDPTTPKPIKAKKTQSLSEIPLTDKDSTSKSSTAPSTPKLPAAKTNIAKKKKTTTTSVATKTKPSNTASPKVKGLLTLKPKPPTSNTPNPINTIKSITSSKTPTDTPKLPSFTQPKVKKTTSTVGSAAAKTKSITKTKSGTTPKIGTTASNTSSTNNAPVTPADKKKTIPKTLIQSPAISPPTLIKSAPVLTAKADMMANNVQRKPLKEEKAVILDIPLYNTSSNDYLDENGTVVVNVLKLITAKENTPNTGLSLEEEKLKKRNMFMNKDDATKLRSDEEDTEAIDDDDEQKTDANAEPKKKAHPMKGKSQIGKYDIEDPFIDDAELLWDEQRAGTKDGFFVFFGPLVEKDEVPKVGRAASSLKRSKR